MRLDKSKMSICIFAATQFWVDHFLLTLKASHFSRIYGGEMSDQDCFQNNDVTGLEFTVKWQNFVKSRNFLDFIDKPLLTTMSLNGTYHTQVKLYEDEMFIWQNQSKDPLTVKSTPVTSCLVNKKRPELLIPWSLTHEEGCVFELCSGKPTLDVKEMFLWLQ